jgi:catecholate siderophore receptor
MTYIVSKSRSERVRTGTVMTLAALSVSVSAPAALAQQTDSREPSAQAAPATALPAVIVRAPQKKKVSKVKSVGRPAPAVAAATSAAPADDPNANTTDHPAAANPYADARAPYKINRSSNAKLTGKILNQPRTIVTIPKEVIEDKGATSIRDLVRSTAGVTLGSGEGGNSFGDRVFIRGFEARNDFYIDGVRDTGVPTRESFNIEQLEILKGPNSTIGGRGTTGGAINVVQKKPMGKDFTDVDMTLGTDLTKRVTIDTNKVFNEQWALRVNGMVQDGDLAGRGTGSNVFDRRWGFAAALEYKPSDRAKVTLDYYFLRMDGLPDWGVPWNPVAKTPMTETGLSRNAYYGIYNRDFFHGSADIGTLTVEGWLNDQMRVTSKLRAGQTVNDYVASNPSTSAANILLNRASVGAQSRYQVNQTVANITDLTWDFDMFGTKHTLVTGYELSGDTIMQDGYTVTNAGLSTTTLNLWNPNTDGWTGSVRRNYNYTTTKVLTKSLFALDTITINPQWILTLGGRMDTYDITRASATSTLTRSDVMWNYNAGLTYKPLDYASVYAAIGTSSNPVGQELDAGSGDYGGIQSTNLNLAPERNTSYELGTKWEMLDGRLLATGALFMTYKDNARETFQAGYGNINYYDSAAYKAQGVEFGLQGNLTDRWSVFGGAVFMSTEVTKSANPNFVGRMLTNVAHNTFNLLTKYKVTDELTVGGQATYKSQIYGGSDSVTIADATISLPSYWRFDLMGEYKINKRASLKLNVNNVFDQLYYDSLYRTQFVYVAPGRSALLTLSSKF